MKMIDCIAFILTYYIASISADVIEYISGSNSTEAMVKVVLIIVSINFVLLIKADKEER